MSLPDPTGMTDRQLTEATLRNARVELYTLMDPESRKADYSIGGRQVSWNAYRDHLRALIADLTAQLSVADGGADVVTALD